MITFGKDEAISNLDRLPLLEWLNSEDMHRSQGPDGSTQICLASLLRSFESAEGQRVFRWFERQLDEFRRKP